MDVVLKIYWIGICLGFILGLTISIISYEYKIRKMRKAIIETPVDLTKALGL
jgi:hypothetical protein